MSSILRGMFARLAFLQSGMTMVRLLPFFLTTLVLCRPLSPTNAVSDRYSFVKSANTAFANILGYMGVWALCNVANIIFLLKS